MKYKGDRGSRSEGVTALLADTAVALNSMVAAVTVPEVITKVEQREEARVPLQQDMLLGYQHPVLADRSVMPVIPKGRGLLITESSLLRPTM